MLVVTVIVCIISANTISSESLSSITSTLNYDCLEEGSSLDDSFELIQNDVDYLEHDATELIDSPSDLKDASKKKAYLKKLQESFGIFGDTTDGCISYYVTLNPKLTGHSQDGFWYMRSNGSKAFKSHEMTDVTKYDPSDTQHVGWYYKVRDNGSATWLDPYWNENADVYMISYVTPLFKDGEFLGVLGMDVDFRAILTQISDIHPYDTADVFVICSNGQIFDRAEQVNKDADTRTNKELYGQLSDESSGDTPLSVNYDGTSREMVYTTLVNHMKLCLSVSNDEFSANVTRTLCQVLFAIIFVFVAFGLIMMFAIRRIVRPLHDMVTITDAISHGKMDARIDSDSKGEIGELTRSFQDSVDRMSEYIADMRTTAYRDALTGVKNSTAYNVEVTEIDEQIAAGKEAEFGVVMADLNDLKEVNDRFGHACGDETLILTSKVLCDIYDQSSVFRVGGDEFVVIMRGKDYENREKLRKLVEPYEAPRDLNREKPWEQVSIACGFATFDPERDISYLDVFHRADADMYSVKKAVCEDIEPRDGIHSLSRERADASAQEQLANTSTAPAGTDAPADDSDDSGKAGEQG
jgi:diguanylate cyclase (GGDEF)-like protein